MHEYEQATGDDEARALFERGVRFAIDAARATWRVAVAA